MWRNFSNKKSPSLVTIVISDKSMKEPLMYQEESGKDKQKHSLVPDNCSVFCSVYTKHITFYGIP